MKWIFFFDNTSPRGEKGATVADGCILKEYRTVDSNVPKEDRTQVNIFFYQEGIKTQVRGNCNVGRIFCGPQNGNDINLLKWLKSAPKMQAWIETIDGVDITVHQDEIVKTRAEKQSDHTSTQKQIIKQALKHGFDCWSPDRKFLLDQEPNLPILQTLPTSWAQSRALKEIDVVLLKDGIIHYLIEVEKTTGVLSGLKRMSTASRNLVANGFPAPKHLMVYHPKYQSKIDNYVDNDLIEIPYDFEFKLPELELTLQTDIYQVLPQDSISKNKKKKKNKKNSKKILEVKKDDQILNNLDMSKQYLVEQFNQTINIFKTGNFKITGKAENFNPQNFNPYFEAINFFIVQWCWQNEKKSKIKKFFSYVLVPHDLVIHLKINFDDFFQFLVEIKS